jgi:hypothetical protein
MGNGINTRFWLDNWLGPISLCEKFPRLFSISLQKEASVASLWNPNDVRGWNFNWHHRMFVWELALLDELFLLLQTVILSTEEDSWGWRPEQGSEFTVKSTYVLVADLLIDRRLVTNEIGSAFKSIWKCMAPSKVMGLVWMVLHDRVPTRDNLYRRKIISENGDISCVPCGERIETVSHLFLYCRIVIRVWDRIFACLGLHFALPHSIYSLLNFVAASPVNKQVRKGLVLIWYAVIWSMWSHRNHIIF